MKLPTIDDITISGKPSPWRGKRILLRLTLNVPIENGGITDDFRIQKVLPTLRALIERGAKVIIASHIGSDGTASLTPIEKYLREQVMGDFSMLPNLRIDKREKENDESFGRELAALADIYINEDFAASHREHASIVSVPKFLPSFVGYQFATEVENLSRFINPPRPCVLIIGGAKLETKLPMIKAFLPKADKIFLGSYFLHKGLGLPAEALTQAGVVDHEKIFLPVDTVTKDGEVVDIGPKTLEQACVAIKGAASVIWNGPLGKFEDGFDETTKDLARAIVASGAKSVVGGGDSIVAIKELDLLDKFTFVSTGGGAMLDFLSHGTLPGIDAIKNCPKYSNF